ncbi:hypothetical protein D6774_02915 [Candidatus Woesearchaeota archaeon]|nr:MAG: hypothetical protein D6774_02915 [Candidatus Woesearchaeota archaeon]
MGKATKIFLGVVTFAIILLYSIAALGIVDLYDRLSLIDRDVTITAARKANLQASFEHLKAQNLALDKQIANQITTVKQLLDQVEKEQERAALLEEQARLQEQQRRAQEALLAVQQPAPKPRRVSRAS